MQSVLVVWEHGGNFGHLVRLLPITKLLRARSCAVTVAVWDMAQARRMFDADIEVVQVPQHTDTVVARAHHLCPADVWLGMGFSDPAAAKRRAMAWIELFDKVRPDALVVDASHFALYAAGLIGLHSVALGNGYELPPDVPDLWFTPWMISSSQDVSEDALAYKNQVRKSVSELSQSLEKLALLLGGTVNNYRPKSIAEVMSPILKAVTAFEETDHFESSLRSFGYVGPIWGELPNATPMPSTCWGSGKGHKVLCYLNLRDRRYEKLWKSLQHFEANVIVLSPLGKAEHEEVARSYGFTVQSRLAQTEELLKTCDATIGEGGIGFASQALAYGKPLFVLPTQLEQALLSYRLTKQELVLVSISHSDTNQMMRRSEQLLFSESLKRRALSFHDKYVDYKPESAVTQIVDMTLKLKSNAQERAANFVGELN